MVQGKPGRRKSRKRVMKREGMWPRNKRCASLITVNLNAEFFWLQLDPEAERMPKTLSMGQYGMTNGLPRILDVFDEHGIKGTFFVPGRVAEIYPDRVREIVKRGHEVANRGYALENMGLLSGEEQRDAIRKGCRAIFDCCGVQPKGFRAPDGELTLETLRIARECGIFYSSNLSDDDRPYWKRLDFGDDLLEIPIHWAMYDLPYFAFNYRPAFPKGQGRIAGYAGVLDNWKDEFDGYRRYGLSYVLQIDPQTIGNPGRTALLEELIVYMQRHCDVWFCTGYEMFLHQQSVRPGKDRCTAGRDEE